MAKANIKYLQEADGHLLYRRRVPQDLKSLIGKNEWVHTLGLDAGQETHAAQIVAEYNLAYASLIAQARVRRVASTALPILSISNGVANQSPEIYTPPLQEKVTLAKAYEYDKKMHGGDRYEKIYQIAIDSLENCLGEIDILTLAPKDVQKWIGECADSGSKPTTINRRIIALRALINRYFREHEVDKRNPFSNPNLKDAKGSVQDRLPFNRDHLKLIDRYFATAPRLTQESRHIVGMLKLTGARPLEIGGLDATDVILEHEVPHIWIRKNAHRRLKTKGSERRIPLIGTALEFASMAKEAKPQGPLFSRNCYDSNSLSQRLNKLIRRAGVPKSSRLVVYSFRHTLEEALRAANVREHTQKRIMGHTDSTITGRYGAPAGMLEELQQAIRSAEPLLGKVDNSIYSEDEICFR